MPGVATPRQSGYSRGLEGETAMRVVIVGPGAIGVWMGERLAAAGWTVSALARGETLKALRTHGFRVMDRGVLTSAPVHASDDPAALGVQDYVIIALKAQALPGLAARLAPLMDADTAVVSAMNGVPWWFFQGLDGPMKNARLETVDPGGVIAQAISHNRVIGCVLHNSNFTPEPGMAQVAGLDKLIFGEPDGSLTPRLEALAKAYRAADVKVETSTHIRTPIWAKLWGNMAANPISALTGAGMSRMLNDPYINGLTIRMMQEMTQIGDLLGFSLGLTPEARLDVARKLGDFRTSMLQDMDAGRPLELDPITGAVVELGERLGVPTPSLSAVYGLARLAAQTRGLYEGRALM